MHLMHVYRIEKNNNMSFNIRCSKWNRQHDTGTVKHP